MVTRVLVIVTGPPCSGKTTYVSEHHEPGDVIIDFDAMAEALGLADQQQRDYTPAQVAVTQYAVPRRLAIKAAITWHLRRHATVWVTDCQPSPRHGGSRYAQAGARHVRLDVDPAELHRRISEARPASFHALADAMTRQPSR